MDVETCVRVYILLLYMFILVLNKKKYILPFFDIFNQSYSKLHTILTASRTGYYTPNKSHSFYINCLLMQWSVEAEQNN